MFCEVHTSVWTLRNTEVDLLPSTQYSIRYPSSPAAPMVSGGRHFTVTVVSVTSSTTSIVGSLVTAEKRSPELLISKYQFWDVMLEAKCLSLFLWLACHGSPCRIPLGPALAHLFLYSESYLTPIQTHWQTWSPKSLIRRWFGRHYKDIFNIL